MPALGKSETFRRNDAQPIASYRPMRLLFVGDVFGRPGRRAVKQILPDLRQAENVDLCIVNGENAAAGLGINKKCADELFGAGADLITLGNHTFSNKEIHRIINSEKRLIRPLNLPPGNPGIGAAEFSHLGTTYVVTQLCGRIFLPPYDCPFRKIDELMRQYEGQTNVRFIVDFHAEATSEKIGLGYYVDGRVSVVIGTHTHVQTADERILPKGTAYITDVGMTGPYHSVIGIELESGLRRLMQIHPYEADVAHGDVRFSAVLVDIDPETGAPHSIRRMQIPL